MSRVVIVGAGGHGREIADVVRACIAAGEDLELLGFVDEDASLHGKRYDDAPVLGNSTWLGGKANDVQLLCGLGAPRTKAAVVPRFRELGFTWRGLIHPRAETTRTAKLGEGVILTAGVVVTNEIEIEIGDHVHLNRNSTVGHDCRVGDYVHLAPGAVLSGHVDIGMGCDIGTRACVIQGLTVGPWTVVGAGAAVVRDLPGYCTAVGVPARVLQRRAA